MSVECDIEPPVRPEPVAVSDLAAERVVAAADEDASEEVFPLSVASGDPSPTGVVLWTRLSPDAFREDEPVFLELADDEAFTDVRFEGVVTADAVASDHDYTLRVDLDGLLAPDRHFFYRFTHAGVTSRTGRCRTLPDPDSSPDSVRFAVLTCQHYQNGYFGAYHHVASEDVDFLVHLGDFIYETAGNQYRTPGSDPIPDRRVTLPSGHDVVWSLADFRELYRTYHADPFLQAALERHTLVRGWDDHAIANDRYWDYEADAPRAPDHPRGEDDAFMRQLTADGIQAWWEYTPARIDYDPTADHLHDSFRLWRSFEFGDLVHLVMTDERLFRTEPLCDRHPWLRALPVCSVSSDPDRTMLGVEQFGWFRDQIRASRGRWTVWANEVLTLPLRVGVGPLSLYPKLDAWDGYDYERSRIMRDVADSDVRNFVTVTGDMHSYLAGYQRLDYPDPLRHRRLPSREERRGRVGVELMTPAVSSVNIAEGLGASEGRRGAVVDFLLPRLTRALVPHVEFFDSSRWGYSTVAFTREACTYRAYSVDKSVNSPDAERRHVTTLRVPDGRVEIQRVD